MLSTVFPKEAAVNEASSQGKRRDLIISTPSWCPPRRIHKPGQREKFSRPGREHEEEEQKKGEPDGEAQAVLTFLGSRGEDPEELSLHFGNLLDELKAMAEILITRVCLQSQNRRSAQFLSPGVDFTHGLPRSGMLAGAETAMCSPKPVSLSSWAHS